MLSYKFIQLPRDPLLRRGFQGFVLSLGAPVGWFLIELLSDTSTLQSIDKYAGVYLYMLFGTATAFISFGVYVGHNEIRLSKLALFDPITDLYNQRYFAERLHEEFLLAKRTGAPLALALIDLDHFKLINDTYGHLAGDQVLKDISTEMLRCVREGEVLARTGGDEFCLILPGCAAQDAIKTARRIRDAVSKSKTGFTDGANISITASIGIANAENLDAKDEQELLKLADQKMYEAKDAGRDQIRSALYYKGA
ncbi:MAG: GGDEF domain-containing protein [Alteromonadaceae bacterium]|nr:MAG: GGDEF domain-containing protein [Alteromonadaceae bacterium]